MCGQHVQIARADLSLEIPFAFWWGVALQGTYAKKEMARNVFVSALIGKHPACLTTYDFQLSSQCGQHVRADLSPRSPLHFGGALRDKNKEQE